MAILAASLAPKFEKAAPDSSTIVVVLVGSDLYIRSAWNQAYDKVQRLRVDGSAPIDFFGDRLVAKSKPNAESVTAYNRAKGADVLRHGADEAPPIRVNGAYAGGNHPGVTSYVLSSLLLDGVTVATNAIVSGNVLKIVESYVVAGVATIDIVRAFDASGLCNFTHTVSPLTTFGLGFYGGVQAQKPFNQPYERIRLYVSGSPFSGGVDITDNHEEFHVQSVLNKEAVPTANQIYATVGYTAAVPRFGWACIYDQWPSGPVSEPLMVSKFTKLYPRSFDPAAGTKATPNTYFVTAGRFGTYPPNKVPK